MSAPPLILLSTFDVIAVTLPVAFNTMLPLSPGGKHAVVPTPQPRGLSATLVKKWVCEVLGNSLPMLPRGCDISRYLQFQRVHLLCREIAEELCRAACP